ncbi:MAG: phytoene/squalene synthase family protein [Bacteroidales bacterium]
MSIDFYIQNSYKISKLITKQYSTSFSLATSLLEQNKKLAIYAIYAFVRLADEIVDSFHGYDKAFLLQKLKEDLDYALKNGISTNTVLTSFADTIKKYNISLDYVDAFMKSMEKDLVKSEYVNDEDIKTYIYGSADVVGLMCLRVFCNGDNDLFDKLKYSAQKLGSAFQKVNFLRDLREDIDVLGRSYFPEISNYSFNKETKQLIELSIQKDFDEAWIGLRQIPGRSKLAVALAFYYYKSLFLKIKQTPPDIVQKKRIRISNVRKYLITIKVFFLYITKMI